MEDRMTPKYLELVEWIKEQIEAKALPPGQKLYSENTLKEMFGVSRQTVRHAIGILENEGLVRRVRGSGTYINDDRLANLTKRMRVSVVTTYVDSYIFPRTIQGIEAVLEAAGYSVQISFTNNQHEREKAILEDIISRDEVSGLIVEPTKSGIPNPNLRLYQEIRRRRIPMLFINSAYPQLKIPHVSINDHMAGWKVTRHLIAMGHQKIGGIFKLDDGQGRLRFSGYMDAMFDAGLSVEDRQVIWVDTEDKQHLDRSEDKVLERFQDCTAVFCYNDEVALGFLAICRRHGIRVPQDISVAGIDDSELAQLGDVPLTSVPHPKERLGGKAAENLLRMIKDPGFDANYEFNVEVVKRTSVQRIKK